MLFIRIRQVTERTGLSRSTIYALAKSGQFPTPIKIGQRASAWLASDVDDWQKQRVEAARVAA